MLGTATVVLEDVAQELARRQATKLSIGAGVDGSSMSDRAVGVACQFMNLKRGDALRILHLEDKTRGFSSKHLQPGHLKNHYEDIAFSNRVSNPKWEPVEKLDNADSCSTLTAAADRNGVELLVLGSFGRNSEDQLDLMGSGNADVPAQIRASHCSVCVVRNTSSKWGGGNAPGGGGGRGCKYLVSTDGSHAAAVAFIFVCKFLYREGDVVDVVHVVSLGADGADDQGKVVEQYRGYLAANKIKGTAWLKTVGPSAAVAKAIPNGILAAVAEREADVLVMGVSGYGQRKLGSVTEEVNRTASCTTLVVKDRVQARSSFSRQGSISLAAQFNTRMRQSMDIVRGTSGAGGGSGSGSEASSARDVMAAGGSLLFSSSAISTPAGAMYSGANVGARSLRVMPSMGRMSEQ